MISSQTAFFYRMLASTITKHQFIRSLQKNGLATEKDRAYRLIAEASLLGRIRIFLDAKDPLWKNKATLKELKQQGFAIVVPLNAPCGCIDWANSTQELQ